MTALKPNAAIRCAILGRDQGTLRGIVGSDFLRLSCLSLLPSPVAMLESGTLATAYAEPYCAPPGARRPAKATWRTRLTTRSAWRRDGLAKLARSRTMHDVHVHDQVMALHINDAMPSQKSPKSKAFASA